MNCPKCGSKLPDLDQVDDGGIYYCLKCGVTLAYNEREAIAVLTGKISPEMSKRWAELAFEGLSFEG